MNVTSGPKSRRLLWTVVLLLLGAAALLWGASAVNWVSQRYRTPHSGERTMEAVGSMVRPELGPIALTALAAVAAVLATGGLLRRLVGVLALLTGGLEIWLSTRFQFAWMSSGGGVPAGSEPIGEMSVSPTGPLLMGIGGLALVVAGLSTAVLAHRMPAMGAKYSAPGAEKKVRDPDKELWDALDADQDPTDDSRS